MESFQATWTHSLGEAAQVIESFRKDPEQLKNCARFSQLLVDLYRNNGNLFVCGNGGSHCDAMHFAEELTGRFRGNRKPLGALALGDPSHVTCVANDYGFNEVFSRQLEGLGRRGDLLVVLSTSGNSENILQALRSAGKIGMQTVGLLGRDGGEAKANCDLGIVVPATLSDRIQELHIKLIHIVIESAERVLFPENYPAKQ